MDNLSIQLRPTVMKATVSTWVSMAKHDLHDVLVMDLVVSHLGP